MFKKYQLKNGLTVLLVESHKSPVLSVQMWVHTGSAQESKPVYGISHFIEHLVFKGTEQFGVGEIARTIEGSGGVLNAYTSFDQTVFYVTISGQYADRGLQVISQMMGSPAFDPDEIDREREVVIEEIKRSNDNPHRQASRLLFSTLFRSHPYGIPVIGYENILREITPKQIRSYFETHYVPSNMTLVIVGDFHISEMKEKVAARFGGMRRRKKRLAKALRMRPPKGSIATSQSPFNESSVFLAWPIPGAENKDIVALDVLSMILGQGDMSRLNRALRLESNLVNSIGAGTFTPKDVGFFAVSASLNVKNMVPALEGAIAVISKLISRPPKSEELRRAILNAQSDEYYGLETVDGMARKFGHFEHLFSDYRYFDRFLRRLAKVKPEDVRRVAKTYLHPERLFLVAQTPEPADVIRDHLEKVKEKYTRAFAKSVRTKNKPSAFKGAAEKTWFPKKSGKLVHQQNKAEKVILKSGTTVLFRPNFDTPVVSVRSAFLAGARREPAGKQGLNELAVRTWVSNTQNRSEAEILGRIEKIAAHLGAYGGRNTCGLSVSALWPFAMEAIELFGEVLVAPNATDQVVDRERSALLEQIRQRGDNPGQIAIMNFMKTLFGDHPYGRDPLGTKESLSSITAAEVQDYLRPFRARKNLTISLAGCFDPDKWLSKLDRLVADLPLGQRHMEHLPFHAPTEPAVHFEVSQKEQTHLILGYPGLTLTDPNRYALQVMEAVLAGQGGRLFVELRDRASLAYTVAPLRMEGVDAGYFGAYIGCSPDKAKTAVSMIKKEFADLQQTLIPEAEIERAKRFLIGHHDIDLQKNGSVAAAMLFDEVYGIDFHETFSFPDRIRGVSPEQILDLAQKIFAQPETISVVGPSSPL